MCCMIIDGYISNQPEIEIRAAVGSFAPIRFGGTAFRIALIHRRVPMTFVLAKALKPFPKMKSVEMVPGTGIEPARAKLT